MDEAFPGAESALTLHELEAQITELCGHLNAANHRWLALIAEFDRRKGWSDGATASCAHWLNYRCGIDMGAAREKVRVAHALGKLPQIAASMGRGELSYSKVRALTRVACLETESYFLSIALHGTASHIERLVRQYRRATEAAELTREARQQAGRSISYSYDEDGSLILRGRLPAESGALLLKALDAAMDAGASGPHGDDESFGARRADALRLVAGSFLETRTGGAERCQIVVHVDAETLRDSAAGRCELEDGPSMAAETARRLGCDASVVRILENERGDPLDVGRRTRSIPPALRRALNARDRGCRFPACTNQRYVDAHHIRHWVHGGETRASNLVTLCHFHHRQVHEGGVRIQTLDDGALRFLRPDGRTFESPAPDPTRPLSDPAQLAAHHRDLGLRINPATAVSRWRGEGMDYGLAIEVLLQRAHRGQPASKE